MDTIKILKSVMLIGLLTFFCGCDESESPLSPPVGTIDQEVLGHWMKKTGNELNYLHITRDPGPGNRMTLVQENISGQGKSSNSTYRIFPTIKNGIKVMNIQMSSSLYKENPTTVKPTVYWFYRYQVTGRVLKVWFPKYDALRSAINSGRIKGRIWSDSMDENFYLTDSPENLRRWYMGLPMSEMYEQGTYTKQ